MRKQHAINPGRSLLLCCILLLPAFVRAHESAGRESILIISSYNPDTRRMSSFITEFEQRIVASGVPCDIYVETLECKGIADAPQWISQIDNLISRYEGRSLRAIVLLGQEAWASFVSLGRIPDGVLCFSCFASENGVMLPAPSDSLQTWKPRAVDYQAMGDSLNRVGGMLNRYDIRRNIELIRSLYPQVENIALVTDNTYGGISLQALVREEWENYPDLNLVLVDSREGEETAFRTFATLPPRSAVMLGTWRVGSDGEYFMQRSLNDLVQNNPRVPVFSVTGTGIGDMAIGGFVPQNQNGGSHVIAGQIRKYYDTDSIEDAHFHTSKSLYLFDSRKLKEWKIAEYALPKGSVIEDTMAAKLSKYSHYIELLVLGCGEAETEQVKQALLEELSYIGRAPLPLCENLAMPRQDAVRRVECFDTVQAKLCMLFTLGVPMRPDQMAAVRLAMALYGGSVTSRLFLNVRERDHLCYYCSSSFQSFTGSMAVNSGVEHADAARAEKAILKELDDLRSGPITAEELEDCRRSLLSGMAGIEDTLGGIETWYYMEVLRGGPVQTPDDARAALQAVTEEDVRTVLRQLTLSVSYLLTREEESAHA